MASSTFQNVRAALVALISARFTTDAVTGVTLSEYPPVGEVTAEDRVWLGKIRVDQQPLSMGGTARKVDEDLEIDLVVWTPRPGGDEDDLKLAEQRAELIFASVENALRASSTVSSTVMFAEVDSFESTPYVDAERVAGMIEATISATANI